MSIFGGRRASTAAPGAIRPETAASGDPRVRAPHFRPAPAPIADAATLDEARTILDDLRVHLAELDRREQSLNNQLTHIEREQRALRLQSQQLEEESREAEQVLATRELQLTTREATAAQAVRDADQRQTDLDRQHADLKRERAELQDLVAAEMADQHRQLAARFDEVDLLQAELEQQRARLVDEVRADFAQQQQDLNSLRSELDARQVEFDRQRTASRDELQAEIAGERAQLAAERDRFNREKTEFEEERARRQAARDQEVAEHAALLAQMRAEQLAEVEAREAHVGQREVDLVKRARFQEDHLHRVRAATAAQQADLERARAALCVWNADVENTIRQRLSHLRKYRDLLERRESDCETAWQQLAEARAAQHASLESLRRNILTDQQALEAHQQTVSAELRRHADLVRLREQEVERRGARFDQLRDELDRRQQLIAAREADLQSAIDWLSDHVGRDELATLLPLLEPAALPEPVIDDQRREIADAERHLSQWQHELQRDREAFAQFIADREQRLRTREAALGRQFEQLAARESALQDDRLRDHTEREQTFAVLEALVDQIEQRLNVPGA